MATVGMGETFDRITDQVLEEFGEENRLKAIVYLEALRAWVLLITEEHKPNDDYRWQQRVDTRMEAYMSVYHIIRVMELQDEFFEFRERWREALGL